MYVQKNFVLSSSRLGRPDRKPDMAAASPTAEQECHHRIANSLQLLMASVSAESKSLTDPAALVASAIGMIVSECMINAVKYAYPSGHSGEIRLSGRIAWCGVLGLCVEDDGCGIGDRKASSGLGMDLLKTMAACIDGVMHWQDARPGTRILLAVPLG